MPQTPSASSGIITVYGSFQPDDSILFPSGQLGTPLIAKLRSFTAGFGYNLTPGNFEIEWIPIAFGHASGKLPALDQYVELSIGSFQIRGNLTHIDYQDSDRGEIIKTVIQDRRNSFLGNIKIFTEDLGPPSSLPSGIVSIGSWLRTTEGFLNIDGSVNETKAKNYERLFNDGATYAQFLSSIEYFNSVIGNIHVSTDKLPTVTMLLPNMSGNIDSQRWRFAGNKLDEAITTILQDCSYDWYYNMSNDTVMLVNKKINFNVTENNIPIVGDNAPGKIFSYGKDIVTDTTKIRVLGGRQEGIVNSPKLSPIDGLNTPASGLIFTKIWDSLTVGFYDANGVYRTYRPSEKEMRMSLKGIEWWTYYKKYQRSTASGGFGEISVSPTSPDIVAATHPDFQSRLDPVFTLSESLGVPSGSYRVISNRRDIESNWIIDWFNRIETQARTHYGRSYVLEGFLFNEASGKFNLTDAAWCNLENQKASGEIFNESYMIHEDYRVFAPFVTDDLRVRAHAVLPSGTVYGPDGESIPVAFTDWNEDASGTLEHYVPCDLREVGGKVRDPKNEQNAFSKYPRGTILCTFPILIGSGVVQDAVLGNLATLTKQALDFSGSGLFDVLDPTELVVAYPQVSGVAIPVDAPIRYGQNYPQVWTAGQSGIENIEIRDDLVPWNFFPVSLTTSVEILNQRAQSFAESRVVNIKESQFAEVTKVGLPTISFDDFAVQTPNASGLYGERVHGVTDLRVSYTLEGWWESTYGIKSYFAQFGREPLLGERNRGILDGIIHPIDFVEFKTQTGGIPISIDVRPYGRPIERSFIERQEKVTKLPVIISSIFNEGSTQFPEQYQAVPLDIDGNPIFGRVVPSRFKGRFDGMCVDGFLNIDDRCMYVNEQTIFHVSGVLTPLGTRLTGRIVAAEHSYFTGGRKLGGSLVTIDTINLDLADVTLKDTPNRTLVGVTVNPGTSVTEGQDALLMDGGGGRSITPFNSDGFYISDGGGGNAAAPVQITEILNGQNTNEVMVVATELTSGLIPSGISYSGIGVIPVGAFARSGDIGVLTQNADGDRFVFISRQTFLKFN